jgi:integrase
MAAIRKRRNKFEVQVRRSGQPHISRTFHDLKDARAWARHMEATADRQDLPTTSDRTALNTTLGELVTRYRETVTPRKRGHHEERIVLAAFGLHPICRKTLAELRTNDFARYRDERLQEVKPTTLKRQLGPVHHLLEIARDEWGFPMRENPLDKLRLDAPDQRRERRLRDGEWTKLITAAQKCRNNLVPMIIRFAVETSMRRGEILALDAADFDATTQSLLVRETKNGHFRTIPLTRFATELLQQRLRLLQESKRETARLFPITANSVRLAWERVTKRAGIDDLHFHDLRHEAISRFFEKGLTVPEVALVSGHRDMRMLFRYAHATRQRVLAKLEAQTDHPEGS